MYKLSDNKISNYYCEFSHGENSCGCTEWQEVGSQRYLQLSPWDAVAGAMDWLEWDEMEEEEKNSIFIKLWRSDHVLVGILMPTKLKKLVAVIMNHGRNCKMEIKGIKAAIVVVAIIVAAGLINSWELGLL